MSKAMAIASKFWSRKLKFTIYAVFTYTFAYSCYLGYMHAMELSKPWYQVW